MRLHLPPPGKLPADFSEEELEKAEKRMLQTEQHVLRTPRPPKRQSKPELLRAINRIERQIDSGNLGERDLYDAIVNLSMMKETYQKMASSLARTVSDRYLARLGVK